MRLSPLVVILGFAALLVSQPAPREQVGPSSDGGFLLNSGWKITPAGRQIPLDTFPMSTALSKDGQYLLVLNGGQNPPSIAVFRAATMEQTAKVPVQDGWLGLTFSPDGKSVYVGGGSTASVFEFTFKDGALAPSRTITLVPPKERTPRDFVGDVAVTPDGRLLFAANLFQDSVQVVNLQTGVATEKYPTGRRPYRILFHPDGQSYFVSSWADGAIYQHTTQSGTRMSAVRLGQHTTDMIWRQRKPTETDETQLQWTGRLFVTAANTNNVYVVGVNDKKELRMIESVNIAMEPRQPFGMTPSALALNAEQNRLFVACSDANAVAVVDLTEADSTVLGFVPTGWYPTAVRSLQDGRLVILNGRDPNKLPSGSASLIDPFDDAQLGQYSDTVLRNTLYRDERLENAGVPAGNPIPSHAGAATPIEHVIYIVKGSRSYDQVLGDLGRGNGDASRVAFDEKTAPNHRKLAREFVLFDNFYSSGETPADGINWAASAIASDYVQKMWPNSQGGRRQHQDYDGGEPTTYPPTGYLWTNAAAGGLAIRNYGWWTENHPKPGSADPQVAAVRDSVLAKVTNKGFRGPDAAYRDTDRAAVFLQDLQEFEKTGAMPRLTLIRISSAAMNDNDQALGTIVEAVSKSKFWAKTAIFVIESSSSGTDHVDPHRAPAYVISPFARRGAIDSTLYNTTSVLRTIELILGLRPMTHFDAAARPMWAAFSNTPDTRPYEAAKPAASPQAKNWFPR